MDMQTLIQRANDLSDDSIDENEVLGYGNDALSQIGAEVNAIFPRVTLADEPVIPERWQDLLLVPYMKGRIKEKDSSQFEWEIGYQTFFENLELFKTRYRVPYDYLVLVPNSEIIVNGETMRVEDSETLYSIAQDETTTVEALLDENEIEDLDFYQVQSVKSKLTSQVPFIYGGW